MRNRRAISGGEDGRMDDQMGQEELDAVRGDDGDAPEERKLVANPSRTRL